MLKNVLYINYMDAFIAGIVAIAVPVMMLEYGVSVTSIGLVFALVPLARIAIRLSSAAAADRMGERVFYSLNAAANLAQAICYSLSSTLGFALGKLFDGARESFIFAVNRTSIIAMSPDKKHKGPAQLISGRLMANALGSLAVFLLVPLGGYSSLLLLIAGVSLLMLYLSRDVQNTHAGKKIRISLPEFLMLGRTRRFYETAGAMVTGGCFYAVMFYIALPIYFKLNGYSLAEIGMLYAAYLLIMGTMMGVLLRRNAPVKSLALAGAVGFVVSLCGISFGGAQLLPIFFLLMSLGDACLAISWERIIYLEARKSRNVSTDIALLHMPVGIALIFTSAASGFIIGGFGYAAIFLLAALSLAAYAFWCMRLDGMKG